MLCNINAAFAFIPAECALYTENSAPRPATQHHDYLLKCIISFFIPPEQLFNFFAASEPATKPEMKKYAGSGHSRFWALSMHNHGHSDIYPSDARQNGY